MASIYKRGGRANRTGSYYIAYTDDKGVRRTVRGCADRQATEAIARKLEADVMLHKRGIIDAKAATLAEHGITVDVDLGPIGNAAAAARRDLERTSTATFELPR